MAQSVGERCRWAAQRLGGAQKPGPGVPAYTRWVNRRLGRYPAVLAYGLDRTPNQVTLISGVVSALGMGVLALGPRTFWAGILVAVLFAGGYALDSADGQLARVSGKGSKAGEWLDHVVDAVRMPAIHLATLIGLFRDRDQSLFLLVPLGFCLLTVGQFFSQILAAQLRSLVPIEPEDPSSGRSFLLLPTDTGTLCWVYVLWGLPVAFAVGYGLLFVLNVPHGLVSMRRKYRHLQTV